MGSDVFELRGNTALYEVLGVAAGVPDAEIRRAYYKLAVVYHPDKNPDGVEVFKEISFAYGILSDPAQRQLYDQQRLRTHLEASAREYDPMMDPNVELSAEDLRRFVERRRAEEEARRKDVSDFERRREEEMRRRAEYDARNPAFRAAYEEQRASCKAASPPAPPAPPPAQPTTAELMQRLEARREAAAKDEAASKGGGASVRQSMMRDFRVRHNGEVVAPHTVAVAHKPEDLSQRLAFVAEMERKTAYSGEVERRIRQCANFDYRSYVEQGSANSNTDEGGDVVDDAILADALGLYDRRR